MNKNFTDPYQPKSIIESVHGADGLPSINATSDGVFQRAPQFEEKRRIAQLAARHIPDHASLFLHPGTTTEEVAKALLNHTGLRVITNHLKAATILSINTSFEVIIAGGMVRPHDHGVVGEAVIDFIHQFKVDFGIIDISGIDDDGALLASDYHDARVAKAIIANSRQTVLLADYPKFGHNALVRLGDLSQIDVLFTDRAVPKPMSRLLTETKTMVYLTD